MPFPAVAMSRALLRVVNLHVNFGASRVLHDVNFDLHAGETLGLVGESGSGKSTLARAILQLIPIASGHVSFMDQDLASCSPKQLRRQRRHLQIVFQDPLASLNPRMRVLDALSEPLKVHEPLLTAGARGLRVAQMLERVGLSPEAALHYPHEFSGGQCQRIGIARAMILRPKLIVCDEPVSSLDVSIQGQIVNLLMDLQRDYGTAMLFISHNLAVVRHVSHRVMVIYRGRLVETATGEALFATPAHPYTRALLAAVPQATRDVTAAYPLPPAEPVRASEEAPGCSFYDRCGYARDACRLSVPPLAQMTAHHAVACHRWREVVYSRPP